ncbi:hypothetical protein ACLOJK_005113 [Asimina triloba]
MELQEEKKEVIFQVGYVLDLGVLAGRIGRKRKRVRWFLRWQMILAEGEMPIPCLFFFLRGRKEEGREGRAEEFLRRGIRRLRLLGRSYDGRAFGRMQDFLRL